MADFTKIHYYDLTLEVRQQRVRDCVGRDEEVGRMERVLRRAVHNNVMVVGERGVGKSAFLHGFVKRYVTHGEKKGLRVVELTASSFEALNTTVQIPLQKYKDAFESMPECVLIIDGFGSLVSNKTILLQHMTQLLKPLAESGKIRLILSLEPKEYQMLEQEDASFAHVFETITLKPQKREEQITIIEQAKRALRLDSLAMTKDTIIHMLDLVERFPTLGCLPGGAVRVIDECGVLVRHSGREEITNDDVSRIVSDKTGVPLTRLHVSQKDRLRQLEHTLNSRVIGQGKSIAHIASAIKRASLGLKNPNKPLGSFLVLGPSGVGKTETAKAIAEEFFGTKKSFTRIDMSEFGEAHTVARLIGAPAGYVGFEAGGGLTNAVKTEPYSLVLLDEMEKAHPKIFDIFLQILDDGRLTSGQGETVDFTQTIIMATSNVAVPEIINGFTAGDDIHSEAFFQQTLVPALSQFFRLEFLNRFDAVLVFQPLSEDDLFQVAMLEIKKVEARAQKHQVSFAIDPNILKKKIHTLADPRFGARPVKRFIETTCENLLTDKLLSM